MKSKKIIALALTAAIAISAASMTAFAKEVKYSTDSTKSSPEELAATVTLKDSDFKSEKTIVEYKAKVDVSASDLGWTKGNGTLTAGKTITVEDYNKLKDGKDKFEAVEGTKKYVTIDDLGLRTYERTITKQQFGWAIVDDESKADGTTNWGKDEDPALKSKAKSGSDKLYADDDMTKNTNGTYTVILAAVGRTDTTDDNIAKNKKEIDAEANKKAALEKREEQLKKLDAENGALDNVNTGSGVETQKAKVTGRTAAADVAEEHDLKVAGLDAELSNLAWVYQVTAPDGLIKGKTARAQLELPDGYTTTGYKVAVYHIKGWCKAEKVKGVSVGTNDVAFWANDFSPYILVLTPTDAIAGTSTGNPSTGDFSAVPVAMLAAAALGATGFVAYKKRKAE